MLIYDLIDIKELEGLHFMIDVKPGYKFVHFTYSNEIRDKSHTNIEMDDD